MKIYKKYLSENRKAIEHSYQKVAENLVSISNMGWKRQLSPLINDVGTGKEAHARCGTKGWADHFWI